MMSDRQGDLRRSDGAVLLYGKMPLPDIDRVAGVVGVNTPPHRIGAGGPDRALSKRFGEHMYMWQFQAPDASDRNIGKPVDRP